MSTRDDDVEEFAALLRQLKARTDRSYGSLARRLTMNTSTLHRYCAGEAVPLDFAPLERFAALCRASPDERLELHRRWIRAVEARRRPRSTDTPADPTTPTAPGAPSPPTENTEAAEVSQATEVSQAPATPEVLQASETSETSEASEVPKPLKAPNDEPSPVPTTRPRHRKRRTLTIALASALLAVLASLLALSTDDDATSTPASKPRRSSPAPTPAASPAPLTWAADSQAWELHCDHDYVIGKQPAQVPPPPVEQDAAVWADTQGAVHGRETLVRISVQGRSSTAVVLEALRVRVVGRDAPLRGTAYSMAQGCGGDMTPSSFAIDLDVHRPTVRPVAGGNMGKPVPARHLPFRVSATDPEALEVKAVTEDCDCRWYLELDWSSVGRTGTVRIDDHGRPFRTSGIKGLPRYWYADRGWTPIVA